MKIYEGQAFTHEHEEKTKQRLIQELDSLERTLGLPLVSVFSFSIRGVDFDCVLFTEFFITIIELKNWHVRITGTENGYWSHVYPNGEKKEIITNRNPYQQVLTCRSRLTSKLLDSRLFTIGRESLSGLIGAGILTYPKFDIDQNIAELSTQNPWFYIEHLDEIKKILSQSQIKHKNRTFELRNFEKFITATLGCQVVPPIIQKVVQVPSEQAEETEKRCFDNLVETEICKNLTVRAAPGSGKTKFIIERTRYLITKKGINPNKIGIITFTNEASNEIQKRLIEEAVVKDENELFSCGTIHSLCYKMIGQWYSELGYRRCPVVIDESKAAKYFDLSLTSRIGAHSEDIFDILKIVINKNLVHPSEINNFLNKYYPSQIETQSLVKIRNDYLDFLKKKNAVCFESILVFCDQLLNSKEIMRTLKEKLNFLLVDEYQDISRIQFEIFRKLGYCAVMNFAGDSLQAIYSFRGATTKSFDWAEKELPEMEQKTMQFNFRSGIKIVDFVNEFKRTVYGKEKNYFKIFAVRKDAGEVYFKKFESQREEAKYISREIRKYLDKGISLSDIAILYRSRKAKIDPVHELANYLKKENIPYEISSDKMRFKNRPHIAKAISFLDATFSDNFDEGHLLNLCDIDPKCTRETRNSIMQFYETGIDLDQFIENLQKKNTGSFTDSLIMKMLHSSRDLQGQSISKAIEMFYLVIYPSVGRIVPDECVESDFYKLFEIGEEFDNYEDFAKRINLEFVEENTNGVTISSIHSAKGLEWKVVFIVGIIDGILPDENSMLYEENDEKNVLYVALTRAKDILYLTYARKMNFKERELSPYLRFAFSRFQSSVETKN